MIEVSRSDYLDVLWQKRDNGLIKIITGVRRVGKSYLLFKLFRRLLARKGIPEDHIIALALDDFKYRRYLAPDLLYEYVTERITDDAPFYVLLDEIQLVEGFVSVLNGFLHVPNARVYVTGSNSKFLSSDVVTEFRGRGDEVRVYPFGFGEYYSAVGGDKWEAWRKYCRYGGMPQTLQMESPKEKESYLKGLFNSVYLADIVNRYKLRGKDEIGILTDILSSSIGALSNPKRISDTFASTRGLAVSQETISRYIGYLEDAFLISRAMRYNVKGRKYIGTPMKYYFVDMGLRNARLNFRQQEETHIMENIIYNELMRRGFSVDVGVVDDNRMNEKGVVVCRHAEVDFVANLGSQRYYIQSVYELPSPEKEKQEKSSLVHIGDSFKKVIVQRNPVEPWHDEHGILSIGVMDFLLSPDSLEW